MARKRETARERQARLRRQTRRNTSSTAGRNTAPGTGRSKAQRRRTGRGMSNIPPAEGKVNNPNYNKAGTAKATQSKPKATPKPKTTSKPKTTPKPTPAKPAPKKPAAKKPAPKAAAPKAAAKRKSRSWLKDNYKPGAKGVKSSRLSKALSNLKVRKYKK